MGVIGDKVVVSPILFVPKLVREILGGRKTVTRRVMGKQPPSGYEFEEWIKMPGKSWARFENSEPPLGMYTVKCPYRVGDYLWVKEAWAAGEYFDDRPPRDIGSPKDENTHPPIWYRADDECSWSGDTIENSIAPAVITRRGKWRSPLFMCRWMSRLILKITGVRAERLQDISVRDIGKEGIALPRQFLGMLYGELVENPAWNEGDPWRVFAKAWDDINEARGYPWVDNCWVFRVEFEVVDGVRSIVDYLRDCRDIGRHYGIFC